jgi:hypothetical protein
MTPLGIAGRLFRILIFLLFCIVVYLFTPSIMDASLAQITFGQLIGFIGCCFGFVVVLSILVFTWPEFEEAHETWGTVGILGILFVVLALATLRAIYQTKFP